MGKQKTLKEEHVFIEDRKEKRKCEEVLEMERKKDRSRKVRCGHKSIGARDVRC